MSFQPLLVFRTNLRRCLVFSPATNQLYLLFSKRIIVHISVVGKKTQHRRMLIFLGFNDIPTTAEATYKYCRKFSKLEKFRIFLSYVQ
jgi:hypothetical protein